MCFSHSTPTLQVVETRFHHEVKGEPKLSARQAIAKQIAQGRIKFKEYQARLQVKAKNGRKLSQMRED